MLLSLDIRKAFDSLSWSYLFQILERWSFSPKFKASLHSLSSNTTAQISLQSHKLTQSTISSGTLQVYLLSPLLFIIAIETLATTIVRTRIYRGLRAGTDITIVHFSQMICHYLPLPLILPYHTYSPYWIILVRSWTSWSIRPNLKP
ncbi:unnamed protein product [Staurois parvus]|uniref:Reverse transcriptase domain-containing protein n=1 Tax=Staurois parvus TaxID=386267 RepID=A0ABN9E9R8_9NEOB|nr:unnamed protein product [Staurois parvus]